MKLTLDQIKRITFGAVSVREKDSRFFFAKCTDRQIEAFSRLSAVLGERAMATTGVRFDFHTNSESFSFHASSGYKFDLYINGVLSRQYLLGGTRVNAKYSADVSLSDHHTKDSTDVRVTLYFPAHNSPAVIDSVSLDDGAYIRPHSFDRRILFIGDSITQGWNAKYDSFSYANRVSRMLNADSVINGVGGAYFDPTVFDSVPFDPDTVIVAYGTNDFAHRKSLESLRENVSGFLSLVAREYLDRGKNVYAISPIPRGDGELVRGMGSFDDCRRVICEEIARYGITHIDGYSLLPYSEDLYADCLHPNDLGFALYAENLVGFIGE